MIDQNCDICMELQHSPSYFSKLYDGVLNHRLIHQTSNFSIVPSIGQIVLGHLLILSNRHLTSAGELSDNELIEANSLVARIREIHKSKYGKDTIVFEHGVPTGNVNQSCGVTHLHIHAVPMERPGAFLSKLNKSMRLQRIDGIRQLNEHSRKHQSYVYVSTDETTHYAIAHNNLPSQFMRKAISRFLGNSNWDWRKCALEQDLLECYQTLKSHDLWKEWASRYDRNAA